MGLVYSGQKTVGWVVRRPLVGWLEDRQLGSQKTVGWVVRRPLVRWLEDRQLGGQKTVSWVVRRPLVGWLEDCQLGGQKTVSWVVRRPLVGWLVCWLNVVSQTPPTVFKSSKQNMLQFWKVKVPVTYFLNELVIITEIV